VGIWVEKGLEDENIKMEEGKEEREEKGGHCILRILWNLLNFR
jgi:hypothetical protein